jgi:hypothetical protein
MLPLSQWTDPALETMLPAYVDLLKNMSLQLGGSPQLFPFFAIKDQESQKTFFPLFSATLETATCVYAQSDSFVHISCLNLIVDLLQIGNEPIQDWIRQAESEQRHLASHVCELLLRRYRRIINLTTGPVIDGVRSSTP